MFERKGLLEREHSPKVATEVILSVFGYGVPDLERARYSANHSLTLIAENDLQPFFKAEGAPHSADPKLYEMMLHQLPWPSETLTQLGDQEVRLKVTLSYFVEPNPGRRGYRKRYSYRSHGLRFQTIRPGQSLANFRAYVNGLAVDEDYDGPEGAAEGWRLGPQMRTRGSIHRDVWSGSAVSLADMSTIAIYPVGGWWKYRTGADRWENRARYSLIVSIETDDEEVDIYTEIENEIAAQIEIEV